MSFLTILKSLDDLLYEVVSWIVFYPVTLWRALRHPLSMMRYADTELRDPVEKQYPDVLSPPQFLLVTLLLSHLIELAVIGDSPLVASRARLAVLISDDTNLIALRVFAFAIYPLMMALRMVRAKKQKLDRQTLKLPFFAQCYAAAPLALVMGIGGTLIACTPAKLKVAGLIVMAMAIVWFIWLETTWFRREGRKSSLAALGNAMRAYFEASLIMIVVGLAMQ